MVSSVNALKGQGIGFRVLGLHSLANMMHSWLTFHVSGPASGPFEVSADGGERRNLHS